MKRMSYLMTGAICAGLIAMAVIGTKENTKVVSAGDHNAIVPYTREEGSGTRESFANLITLSRTDLFGNQVNSESQGVTTAESSQTMIGKVRENTAGIGYVSYSVVQDEESVKMLDVNQVAMTSENIQNGSYPLIRNFQLVSTGNLNTVQKEFLRFVKSEGQGMIEQYCIPVRNQGIFMPLDAEGTLTISGSTSMTPMMETLARAYMEANPKVTVTVKSSDSEQGIKDVLSGESGFGMVSRDLKTYESSVVSVEQIGWDGIAIIVNPANEISSITTEQLRRIYEKKVTSWDYLRVVK